MPDTILEDISDNVVTPDVHTSDKENISDNERNFIRGSSLIPDDYYNSILDQEDQDILNDRDLDISSTSNSTSTAYPANKRKTNPGKSWVWLHATKVCVYKYSQ